MFSLTTIFYIYCIYTNVEDMAMLKLVCIFIKLSQILYIFLINVRLRTFLITAQEFQVPRGMASPIWSCCVRFNIMERNGEMGKSN